jgi:tetratricopeptide (TPR) repeat protein
MRIVALILMIVFVYFIVISIRQFSALTYFGKGLKTLSTSEGNPEIGDQYFGKAISYDNQDVYYQARAEANLLIANSILNQTKNQNDPEVVKKISDAFNNALTYSRKAESIDPRNYYNFISEARVSESANVMGVKNAYENAVNSYKRALDINKTNPAIYLSLAKLQANNSKLDDALLTLGQVLQIKNDYLDAIFLASQIYATQGKISDAIVASNVATKLNPNSPVLWFQSGILKYTNKDYTGAVSDLSDSVKLQPDYANAKYFLGLSYARLDKYKEAEALFAELAKQNTENKEVVQIWKDLKAGVSPFQDSSKVKASTVKNTKLPIKEKTQ